MDRQLKLTVDGKKEILITGYIKRDYSESIPEDIHKIVIAFYDEVVSFNIDNTKLQKFLSGEKLFGDHFTVNNLTFRCALYPDRDLEKFSLQLLMEPNISKVIAYFFMYNIQADTYWKGTVVFDKNDIVEGNDKNPNDNDDVIWSINELPLIDYSDYKRLDLSIWTQILSIKYNENCGVFDYNLDIKMAKDVKFTWNVKGEELKQWIDCEILKAFPSNNFPSNDKCFNWVISIIPNGWSETTKGMVIFYMDLVRMPNKIKSFNVDWKLTAQFNDNNVSCNGHRTFGYGLYWLTHMFPPTEINNDSFKELTDDKNIQFIIEINITTIKDFNGNEIEKENWHSFGIIDT